METNKVKTVKPKKKMSHDEWVEWNIKDLTAKRESKRNKKKSK
jgi:hypothetical protein